MAFSLFALAVSLWTLWVVVAPDFLEWWRNR